MNDNNTTKRKRGRKPLNSVKVINEGKVQMFMSNSKLKDQCLVVHVPIDSSDEEVHTSQDNINVTSLNLSDEKTNLSASRNMNMKNNQLELEIKILQAKYNELQQKLSMYHDSKFNNYNYSSYEHIHTMPEGENICCWWCTHEFNDNPIYIPYNKTDNDTYLVVGHFCSFNCAASYNFKSLSGSDAIKRHLLMQNMYSTILNDYSTNITPAPPRELLQKFGGTMTIEQFRSKSKNYGRHVQVVLPPMKSVQVEVTDEIKQCSFKQDSTKYIPIKKDEVEKITENLKLKRTNPVNNSNSSIEKSFGLVRISKKELYNK